MSPIGMHQGGEYAHAEVGRNRMSSGPTAFDGIGTMICEDCRRDLAWKSGMQGQCAGSLRLVHSG